MHLTSLYGLLFNPGSTLSSSVISSSKQKQEQRLVEVKAMLRSLNLCGKKYGSCHYLVESEISYGEPVEMRFRQWKICTAAVWLIARYAPSVHNMMRTYFTPYGLVRASHRFGMKTCSGVSRTTWLSRIFLSWCSTYSAWVVVWSSLQCKLGRSGFGGIRSKRHPRLPIEPHIPEAYDALMEYRLAQSRKAQQVSWPGQMQSGDLLV